MNDGHLFFTHLWSRARTGGGGPSVRGTAAERAPAKVTTVSADPPRVLLPGRPKLPERGVWEATVCGVCRCGAALEVE